MRVQKKYLEQVQCETHEDDGEEYGSRGTRPSDGSGLKEARGVLQRQHLPAKVGRASQKAPAKRAQSFFTHLALDQVSGGLHSGLGLDVSDGSDTDGGKAGDGRESLHCVKRVLKCLREKEWFLRCRVELVC